MYFLIKSIVKIISGKPLFDETKNNSQKDEPGLIYILISFALALFIYIYFDFENLIDYPLISRTHNRIENHILLFIINYAFLVIAILIILSGIKYFYKFIRKKINISG